ncbi:hypothetical protein [Pseudochrobactrum kiredjianiae]|uniref:Autotransporter outer membrane beta-barrel domain-containing protein n=1 Tax=Pseudochrobactrum kiredjianiae TaxID=386305 RepID=A0ABW3UZJ5_9HYPH|nr:hypothetical protein [Pseudochrobactrum kiredjianiae]MDM7853129.1 hypothetical protein [Pseudochrobactrum kiredjianiae]
MQFTGNNVTLTNNGTIDPSRLGFGLGVVSSGGVVGAAAASNAFVTNNGTMKGSTGVAINGVTGMALSVQNGTGGTSHITNTGSIGSTPLTGDNGRSRCTCRRRLRGGAVNMTNSGTINGSVSMGASDSNTFNAATGSSVNKAGGTGTAFNIVFNGHTLNIAAQA